MDVSEIRGFGYGDRGWIQFEAGCYAQDIVSRRQLFSSMMYNGQHSGTGKSQRLPSPIIGTCMSYSLHVHCMQNDQARLASGEDCLLNERNESRGHTLNFAQQLDPRSSICTNCYVLGFRSDGSFVRRCHLATSQTRCLRVETAL